MSRRLVSGLLFGLVMLMSTQVVAQDRPDVLDLHQSYIVARLVWTSILVGLPPEVALANSEIETRFRDVKAKNSSSYGPLQVHISSLEHGETLQQLRDLDWNTRRGIEMLKVRLQRAKGDAVLARVMHVCGEGWKHSCSPSTVERIKLKWKMAAKRWRLKGRYRV